MGGSQEREAYGSNTEGDLNNFSIVVVVVMRNVQRLACIVNAPSEDFESYAEKVCRYS